MMLEDLFGRVKLKSTDSKCLHTVIIINYDAAILTTCSCSLQLAKNIKYLTSIIANIKFLHSDHVISLF